MWNIKKLNIAKRLITGIFRKNHELMEIDDDVFLKIIRSGIEEAAKNDKGLYNDLLDHSVKSRYLGCLCR
jgi:hypothetical protein